MILADNKGYLYKIEGDFLKKTNSNDKETLQKTDKKNKDFMKERDKK